MDHGPSDGGSNLHPGSLYKTSSVSSEGDRTFTHAGFGQSEPPVVSLGYRNSFSTGLDCVTNDVCSLNPSQALKTHQGMISDLKKGNGNSWSLSFNQSDDKPASREKTVHLMCSESAVPSDGDSVGSRWAGLEDHNQSDDMADFDIDDFSENDIPDYCEPPRASPSAGSSSSPKLSVSCNKKELVTPAAAKPSVPG